MNYVDDEVIIPYPAVFKSKGDPGGPAAAGLGRMGWTQAPVY